MRLACAALACFTACAPAKPESSPPEPTAIEPALTILPRLVGLWSGPATDTPLGDFALMNVDLRDASPHVLFGRVDLDAQNALRFAFSIETHHGVDTLVYRNGGFFAGLVRDMRTVPVEVDAEAGAYRFCHVDKGCGYIDAVYSFTASDQLLFDVKVKGEQHVLWDATRLAAGSLPAPFPADLGSQGGPDTPFPPMPRLEVTVSWAEPLAAPADVWVLLSLDDCTFGGACVVSRSIKAEAAAGAETQSLAFEQIHAGAYKANVVLDRNQNLETMLVPYPDAGDGVSLPNRSVDVGGESEAALSVVYDL